MALANNGVGVNWWGPNSPFNAPTSGIPDVTKNNQAAVDQNAAFRTQWTNNIINSLPQVQAAGANRSNAYSVIDAGLKNLRGILGASLNRKRTQAQKDRDRALLASKGALAGRGLLFSGETGYQEGLDQENYSNTLGDLMDAYNTSLSQGEMNAALNKLSADSAYQQALASAYDFVSANPQLFTPPDWIQF